jgi:hypothetical protein
MRCSWSGKVLAMSGPKPVQCGHEIATSRLRPWIVHGLAVGLSLTLLIALYCLVPLTPRAALHCGDGSNEVIFSADGRFLVTTTDPDRNKSDCHSGRLQVWNVATGQRHFDIDGQTTFRKALCSPDSRLLAAENEGGETELWDLDSGRERADLRPACPWRAYPVSFSPGGRFLILRWDECTVQEEPPRMACWDLAWKKLRGNIRVCLESRLSPAAGAG